MQYEGAYPSVTEPFARSCQRLTALGKPRAGACFLPVEVRRRASGAVRRPPGGIFLVMKPPAFQFYVDNFREGVCDMTQDEVGAYILLLCYQWSQGAIPKERARMERAAAGPVSDHVLRKFQTGADGELRNERLEREREKQTAFRESRAINGSKGGRPKASENLVVSGSLPVAEPTGEPKKSSPSPVSDLQSSLSVPVPDSKPPSIPAASLGFDEFWKAYPRRVGKGNAEAAWKKHKCDSILPKILEAVAAAKESSDWKKEAGQFIPHPATWLNRQGWEDEIINRPQAPVNRNARPAGFENWKSPPNAGDPENPEWGTQAYVRKHGAGI